MRRRDFGLGGEVRLTMGWVWGVIGCDGLFGDCRPAGIKENKRSCRFGIRKFVFYETLLVICKTTVSSAIGMISGR